MFDYCKFLNNSPFLLSKRSLRLLYTMTSAKYEEAINYINSLQSNAEYLQNINNQNNLKHTLHSTTIERTRKYLARTGITLEQLDALPVIHVSGTKGKGSTCALCESILRHHGYKTGFYSSPHLIHIRERIKINGKPLQEDVFADNVISIYNKLVSQKDDPNDMPLYFRFLTLVAYNVFIAEKVDVAVVEVGIGGEYDCTNILRKTQVVGISRLGIDHTTVLGNTLEEIAWQKGGIMKPNATAVTVEQPEVAMTVLKQRAIERQCPLSVVPKFEDYKWCNDIPILGINGEVQKENASLAIQLSHYWMSKYGNKSEINDMLIVPSLTKAGLAECKWPGRFQILKSGNKTIFLDGAHTVESIEKCVNWFKNNSFSSNKVLLFNIIGQRSGEKLLEILNTIVFNQVIFVPNCVDTNIIKKDQVDILYTSLVQLERCEQNKTIWTQIQERSNNKPKVEAIVLPSISEALNSIPTSQDSDILITGSIRLVGAALTLLDPNLTTF